MKKEDFISMPFVLGISIVVLTVAIAALVAVAMPPCNGSLRWDKQTVENACSAALSSPPCFTYTGETFCNYAQMVVKAYSDGNAPLFLSLQQNTGNTNDHAVELYFPCGIVHSCYWFSDWYFCSLGGMIVSPTTLQPVMRYCTHFDTDDCVNNGG